MAARKEKDDADLRNEGNCSSGRKSAGRDSHDGFMDGKGSMPERGTPEGARKEGGSS